MIQLPGETAWQHYERMQETGDGWEDYICAEFISIHKAMELLKQSNGTFSNIVFHSDYGEWLPAVSDYAVQLCEQRGIDW